MKFDELFFFEVDDNRTIIIENHLFYVSVKVKDKTKPLFMRKKTIYRGNKDDGYHSGFFHALDLLIDDFSTEEYYRYNLSNDYSPFKLFISTIKYDPYGFIETISNMKHMSYEEQVRFYLVLFNYVCLEIDAKLDLDKKIQECNPINMMENKQYFYQQSLKELQQY